MSLYINGTNNNLDVGFTVAGSGWHLYGISADRSGNAVLYTDGVEDDTNDISDQSAVEHRQRHDPLPRGPRQPVQLPLGHPRPPRHLAQHAAVSDRLGRHLGRRLMTRQRLARRHGSSGRSVGPPVISSVTVIDITTTTARITWTVAPDADGQVDYGPTAAYGSQTAKETSYLPLHSQALGGLTAATTYHYRVTSINALGTATTVDATFDTAGAPVAGVYPPDVLDGDFAYIATPNTALPTLLAVTAEPTFDTEFVLVNPTSTSRNRYASKAAWTGPDGDFLLLDYGTRPMLDGRTYAVAQATSGAGNYAGLTLYNQSAGCIGWISNQVRRGTISAAGLISAPTITTLSDYAAIDIGGYQGSGSNDDRYFAFSWKKASNAVGFGVWDNVASSVVTEVQLVSSTSIVLGDVIDNLGMSQSGEYVIVQGDPAGPIGDITRVYTRAGAYLYTLPKMRHWDAGVTEGGTDVIVMCAQQWPVSGVTGGTHIVAFRTSDGVATDLMDYWPSGHISCRNIRRPGWCYISEFWTTAQGSDQLQGQRRAAGPQARRQQDGGTLRARPEHDHVLRPDAHDDRQCRGHQGRVGHGLAHGLHELLLRGWHGCQHMTKRPCVVDGCWSLTDARRPYCATHARQREQARGPRPQYNADWRRLRAMVIGTRCADCGSSADLTVEHSDLSTLCRGCNTRRRNLGTGRTTWGGGLLVTHRCSPPLLRYSCQAEGAGQGPPAVRPGWRRLRAMVIGTRCADCGSTADLTVEHSDLSTLCRSCNTRRRNLGTGRTT